MDKMINIASDFQYSVNINYDINNDKKIRNFIATNASLKLLEDILLSTQNSSTERARILKNAFVADGCIVGAESVVATQFYEKNCVIVGNPAKIVRHNTTWDRQNYLDYISKGPFIYE